MTTTATITAARTLSARVIVHGSRSGRLDVEVISGIGGWNAPGKRLTVAESIASDFRTEQPAPAAPVETAAPVIEQSQESAELVEARAELARLNAAAVANFLAPVGGRGKQGKRRADASIRRGAQYVELIKQAERKVAALEIRDA